MGAGRPQALPRRLPPAPSTTYLQLVLEIQDQHLMWESSIDQDTINGLK